jgi:mannose-6-phosphate isomerase-like protein (cupin superfamily)
MFASQPSVLSPKEGEKFAAGPFDIITRVSGDQSGGAFEMYELALGVATVDYHVHNMMEETLYVLEGTVEFRVGAERFARPAGSVAFVPRGVHHGFSNHGPGRARVLILFTPSAHQDQYFRELVKLFAAPTLDTAKLHQMQKQYDQELIDADR